MGASVTIVDNAPHDSAGGTRRASPERAVREILDLRAKGDVEAILEVLAGEELLLPARAAFRCERKAVIGFYGTGQPGDLLGGGGT